MNVFDMVATLVGVAAVSAYLNYKLLRLPPTSGMLAVALASSALLVALDAAVPQFGIRAGAARFVGRIDFNQTLMRGMLAFLLFAAAMQLNVEALVDNRWTVGILATCGVVLSTGIIGGLMWSVFALLRAQVPVLECLIFGALISPTDPVAVVALLKQLHAPAGLEAQIAGESLFNDGVGVVLFTALASLAGLAAAGGTAMPIGGLPIFFAREVGGGALLGLTLGYLGYRSLKTIDDHPLELLITIALVMITYAVAFRLHVSGPLAVVVAGLVIGSLGRKFAMSARTRDHVDAFWNMTEEILNAVLFLMLGLQIFTMPALPRAIAAAVLSVAVVLLARMVSVGLPVAAIGRSGGFVRGIVPLLTWSGLRGGLSVAMMLSLPPFPSRDALLACTYAVVVFSILVQGLTMRRVLVHYGIGTATGD